MSNSTPKLANYCSHCHLCRQNLVQNSAAKLDTV